MPNSQHIQEDEALARRFRCVQVPEPTLEETRRILYNVRSRLERNYAVRVTDETLETALELSPRYMRHLRLPDKVIGWLDTAAVRAEIDGRWEVEPADVVSVIFHAAQIPEDMISRDVTDRFKDIERLLQDRVIGQQHDHDVEYRVRTLPQADEPARVLIAAGRRRRDPGRDPA